MMRAISLVIIALVGGDAVANQAPTGPSLVKEIYSFTGIEILGSAAIVVLCLVVIAASYFLRKNADFSEEGVIRLVSLILIVAGTMLLVTLGYSTEQIAPALGILGTIAGYMLGRASRAEGNESQATGAKPK